MKRFLALILVLCLALCVASCNTTNDSEGETTAAKTEAPTTEASTTEAPTTEAPTTEAATEAVTEADTGYTVRVVDTDGNAVKGAWIMICKGDACSVPVETDADGYARFPKITDEGRQAKIAYPVDGYVVDTTKYIDFEAGSFEMTIVLEKA